MSDMYLTKTERKTIFTQGLIYVLFTFIISDLTVVGPHIFVIFPWLYILGILGVNKFYHPVLTLAISCITTFMANLFKYNLGVQALSSTLISTAVVAFGIITGLSIKEFVFEHRLVKYLSWKKKILNISCIVILTFLSLGIYAYQYGNVFSFIKSKSAVKSFVEEQGLDYAIQKYQYMSGTFDEYVYKVNVFEEDITLQVKNRVSIANFASWQNFLSNRLNTNFTSFNSSNNCVLNYEFEKNSLKPTSITAVITVEELNKKNVSELEGTVKDIQNTLKYKDEFGLGVEECILVMGESMQTLNKSEFDLIDVNYLIQNSKVENLEDN